MKKNKNLFQKELGLVGLLGEFSSLSPLGTLIPLGSISNHMPFTLNKNEKKSQPSIFIIKRKKHNYFDTLILSDNIFIHFFHHRS